MTSTSISSTTPAPKRRQPLLARRAVKLLFVDGLAFATSLTLALAIRFDFQAPNLPLPPLHQLIGAVVLVKLILFYCFRQFHILPDFFSIPDLSRLFLSNAYASCVVALVGWESLLGFDLPLGVITADFVLSFLAVGGIRLALRLRREFARKQPAPGSGPSRRVGIVGAGEAGAILARELLARRGLGLEPVAFFDDDARKWDASVRGIPVLGRPEMLLSDAKARGRIDEVVISMPSAPPARIREVIGVLQSARLTFRTVPSLTELALGKVQVSQLRDVQVEDLLGRPPVELSTDAIRQLLQGKTVLITGAGGSIGSELCRQVASFEPARLLLVERSEAAMFVIEQELIRRGHGSRIVPLVMDILDRPRLRAVFAEHRPAIIFHAAAHKHVPMMESQPGEAIRNNVFGTVSVAEAAAGHGAERFVLISTDKAINPTSVMGATKRLAEVFLQAFNSINQDAMRLMAVRFGNVLGSSGSVIPIFKNQIAAGGPVTVTHPDVTRYFMTIPEAVGLVLQSAVQGAGGEVFVLDMGKPVRIVDLARHLIELSGLEPETDIAIQFTGLRPGEKLFEELNLDHESLSTTAHPMILRLRAFPRPLTEVQRLLREFNELVYKASAKELRQRLQAAVPEYAPTPSHSFEQIAPGPEPGMSLHSVPLPTVETPPANSR